MASIYMAREEFKDEVKEVIGYKSGLNIEDKEIIKFLDSYSIRLWQGDSTGIRFRPEEYENIIYSVLSGVGYTNIKKSSFPGFEVLHKYRDDKKVNNILHEVFLLRNAWWKLELDRCMRTGSKSLNPQGFIEEAYNKYGKLGMKLAIEITLNQVEHERCSPWNSVRRVDWENIIDLKDLFKSEGLETSYGSFIDQRYINYLYKNFDEDIDSIHWRKFEAITCEYFERNGYHVKIGEGRNDGGIDARIWRDGDFEQNSPTIIVQCKRQKSKVSNTVVKALYADVLAEGAESGLIVTSTKISPSGKSVAKARGYNVDWCERDTLKKWIEKMRHL